MNRPSHKGQLSYHLRLCGTNEVLDCTPYPSFVYARCILTASLNKMDTLDGELLKNACKLENDKQAVIQEQISLPGENNITNSKLDEKKLLRKIDWAIIPWVSILYLLSFLDRANIGNARVCYSFWGTNHLYLSFMVFFPGPPL